MNPRMPRARRAICPGCDRSVFVTRRDTFDEHSVSAGGAMADVECDWSGSEVPLSDGDFWDDSYDEGCSA